VRSRSIRDWSRTALARDACADNSVSWISTSSTVLALQVLRGRVEVSLRQQSLPRKLPCAHLARLGQFEQLLLLGQRLPAALQALIGKRALREHLAQVGLGLLQLETNVAVVEHDQDLALGDGLPIEDVHRRDEAVDAGAQPRILRGLHAAEQFQRRPERLSDRGPHIHHPRALGSLQRHRALATGDQNDRRGHRDGQNQDGGLTPRDTLHAV
jgi:hypothetical protein